jgi:hypothetical protein
MNERTLDQADEEILACEVSDDALEAAADAAEGRPQVPSAMFSGPVGFPDFCC